MNELEIIKQLNRLSSSNRLIKKEAIRYFAFNPDPRCISIIRNILICENDQKIIRWASYALALNNDYNSIIPIDKKIKELDNPDSQAVEWLNISKEILKKENRFNYIISLLNSTCIDDVKEGLILSFAYEFKPSKLLTKIINNPFTSHSDIDRWTNLTLGNTKSFKDSSIIIPYLYDSNYLVREWAAWALSKIVDIRSMKTLRNKINDPNPRVREWISKALSKFDTIDNTYLLLDHYHKEKDILCKEGIIRSLNANNQIVRDFVEDELESQINSCAIITTIALLDKLSQYSMAYCDFDILKRLLSKYDNSEIREAVAEIALKGVDRRDWPTLIRISSDPNYEFILDCIREFKIFAPEYLYDKKKFINYKNGVSQFHNDIKIFLNGEEDDSGKTWEDYELEKDRFMLFIDEPKRELWIDHTNCSDSFKKTMAFELLCLIASISRGETLDYRIIYNEIWPISKDKTDKQIRGYIQKQIEIRITPLFGDLENREKYLIVHKGGVQTTKNMEMIIRTRRID